jgi:hypothetical protein
LLYFTVTAETKLVAAPHLGVEVSKEGWPSFGQLFPLFEADACARRRGCQSSEIGGDVKSEVTDGTITDEL